MKKLYITHIDNGAGSMDPFEGVLYDYSVMDDPYTGAWPKVSFSNGRTFSYLFLTNTKILFFTGLQKKVFSDSEYEALVKEFLKSDRPYNESNWCNQAKRVSTWKPETWQLDLMKQEAEKVSA